MNRFAILAAAAAIMFTASACATGRWESEDLVDSRNVRVALEHRVEDGQVVEQNFEQPAAMEPALIAVLLGDLFYMEEPELFGEPEKQPVFQAQEIGRLAPALSAALQKASPNQRIRFTSHNKGGGLIFKDQRKTSGVLFVDADDRLNIAFSYINRITDYDDRVDAYGTPDPDPLTIESADTPVIAKAAYIEHHLLPGGKPSPMWLEADPAELRTAVKAPPVSEPAPKTPEKPEVQQNIEPAEPQEPAPAPATASPDWQDRKDSIKTKLEYLKELHEEGLISKTEYETKKQELLNRIK